MIAFGNWSDGDHEGSDQQARLSSAAQAKTTPSQIDTENETATFEGSGKKPYTTTLNTCTCGDFLHRHLPCKHIYRLAMELGYIDCSFKYGRNKNDIVNRIPALSPEAKELLLKVMSNGGIYPTCSAFADELVVNGFCIEELKPNSRIKAVILETMQEVEENRSAVLKELNSEIRKDNKNVPDNIR